VWKIWRIALAGQHGPEDCLRTQRGKRRSQGQRIGEKGEALFAGWAVDHHLSPNKVTQDYGVDYFCQIMRSVGTKKMEESTGTVLVVQVRSTQGRTRPRVSLTRTDATDLLRQTHPTCLVAVHAHAGTIHFLFRDEPFIARLQNFLASKRESISFPLAQMQTDAAEFERLLDYHSRPGTQQRLLVHHAQLELARVVPGASLSIQQNADRGHALVQVPWLGSIFQVAPEMRKKVLVAAFESGEFPAPQPGVKIRPEIAKVLNLVDGDLFVAGRASRDIEFTVEWKGQKVTEILELRTLDDEFAFTHKVGLRLGVSQSRRDEQGWVHELHASIFSTQRSFADWQSALPFLRLFRPGARFFVRGGPFLGVDDWGPQLGMIGPFVEAVEKVSQALRLDLGEFELSDLKDEEFTRSLAILEAVAVDGTPIERIANSFLVGMQADLPIENVPLVPVVMDMPVVLNLKMKGYVLWFTVRGSAYLDEGERICGLRFEEQKTWRIEPHHLFAKSKFPEMWVHDRWPALKLGDVGPGVYSADREPDGHITLQSTIRSPEELP
jgi:hypothetical protein